MLSVCMQQHLNLKRINRFVMSSMNEVRRGVLAGGNFIVDTVKIIDKWPEQDTLCSVLSHTRSNGGGPYNISKNLSKLDPDLPLEACGLVGEDLDGGWVREDCAHAGIDTRQLRSHETSSTSVTDAMTVFETGRRTFFHERGANAELDVSDFDFSQTNAKIFSLGYLMLLDKLDVVSGDGTTGAASVIREARRAGLITAVDVVSAHHPQFRAIAMASLKEADIFFVNELEAGWIVGYDVSLENMESAVRDLASYARRTGLVVIHMPQGAIAYSVASDQVDVQPAVHFPSDQIVGATGAGDAFATGFLYGVHEDWSVKESLHCAVCVAAMSLTHSSPSEGIRSLGSCLELGERYGYKRLNI